MTQPPTALLRKTTTYVLAAFGTMFAFPLV